MTSNNGLFKYEDSALILIDYQKEMFDTVRSETPAELIDLNVRLLIKAAKAFDMPIILSTVGVEMGVNHPTRQSILDEWTSAATLAAWRKWHPKTTIQLQAMTDALLAAARVRPGLRVLDLASGTGQPALDLARLASGRHRDPRRARRSRRERRHRLALAGGSRYGPRRQAGGSRRGRSGSPGRRAALGAVARRRGACLARAGPAGSGRT